MRGRALTIVLSVLVIALIAASTVGCSNASTPSGGSAGGSTGAPGGSGMMGGGSTSTPGGSGMMGGGSTGGYTSVGQRIYLTGVGSDGRSIPRTATTVSSGSLMMSGGGCGGCHAANGHGGTIRMMMGTTLQVPNITYVSLIKQGFSDATIRRAILGGLDEAGDQLNAAMPRWQMTAADLDATIAYLKTLQ